MRPSLISVLATVGLAAAGCGGHGPLARVGPTSRTLSPTGNPLDLAVDGEGMFAVSAGTRRLYTRDGRLRLETDGRLVHAASGHVLLGWPADGRGQIKASGPLYGLHVPVGLYGAVQATTEIALAGNLDAAAPATETFSAQVRVYDSLGESHDLTIKFHHRHVNGAVASWEWTAFEGDDAWGIVIGSSTIEFDDLGVAAGGATGRIVVPGTAGAPSFPITFDFKGIAGLQASSQIACVGQNGFPPGTLEGYEIGANGVVTGLFTNGMTRPLGQIALATFAQPARLSVYRGKLGEPNGESGPARMGLPTREGRGSVASGFTELAASSL